MCRYLRGISRCSASPYNTIVYIASERLSHLFTRRLSAVMTLLTAYTHYLPRSLVLHMTLTNITSLKSPVLTTSLCYTYI